MCSEFKTQMLPTTILTRSHALLTYETGRKAESLAENHWLILWINKALAGGMTGYPITLVEKPDDWTSFAASGLRRWVPDIHHPEKGDPRGAVSSLSQLLPQSGVIWLDTKHHASNSNATQVNERFTEMWYMLFFEIGNLMAAQRYEGIWEQAVKGEISELRFVVLNMSTEIASHRVACQLFRGLILPLIGESRVPQNANWRYWEKLHCGKAPVPEPKQFWAMWPDHFEYYRAAYRKARAQRPAGDSGGRKAPP